MYVQVNGDTKFNWYFQFVLRHAYMYVEYNFLYFEFRCNSGYPISL
jgi:hypothetical protein